MIKTPLDWMGIGEGDVKQADLLETGNSILLAVREVKTCKSIQDA